MTWQCCRKSRRELCEEKDNQNNFSEFFFAGYGGNLSDTGDREGKSPVVARSANVDFEKSNFAAKLDYLSRELEIIEKTLTDLQAENKKARLVNFHLYKYLSCL